MLVSDTPLEGQNFGKVVLEGCADVADVTKSACKEFGWGAPKQVRLHLAAAGGDEPSTDAIKSVLSGPRLQASWKLDRAHIGLGSWLLARVPPPAPARCGRRHARGPPRHGRPDARAGARSEHDSNPLLRAP